MGKGYGAVPRRGFMKTLGADAVASIWADSQLEAWQGQVNTNSKPSDLKITDMRVAVVGGAPMRCPLLRIDTNQGVYGLGEVRDGASKNYALMLKSRLLNENHCNVDRLFRKVKQFGGHARQGGGVCGVEMALMDLAGKAYGIPAYALAGGKFRDRIRMYCDTPNEPTGAAMVRGVLARLAKTLGSVPPLNMWVRTAPRGAERFCWRIDLLPRLAHLAGLEVGAGVHLNVLTPERAAEQLRQASG